MHIRTTLPRETEDLIRSYFRAFASLYGIISLNQALRIIQKQNPELGLTEKQFVGFVNQFERKKGEYYMIAGVEDICEGIVSSTPIMEHEIIAEDLYSVDDTFNEYKTLKIEQGDKPFYIPEKAELLRYQDDDYFEETAEIRNLRDFLHKEMNLESKCVESLIPVLQLGAVLGDTDVRSVINVVERHAGELCFSSQERTNEFFQLYFALCNHTRTPNHRGFTPAEMGESVEEECIDFGSSTSRMPITDRINVKKLQQAPECLVRPKRNTPSAAVIDQVKEQVSESVKRECICAVADMLSPAELARRFGVSLEFVVGSLDEAGIEPVEEG